MITYPFTVAKVGRQDFVLAAHLKLPLYDNYDAQNGVPPLQMFKKFACLKLNFSNSKTKTGADGNIELDKLDSVWLKTQACIPMLITPSEGKENALLTVLSFVPNTYGMHAKKSCIQIGRDLPFQQAYALGEEMCQSTGRYAQRNIQNGTLLKEAAYVAEAERQGILPQLDTEDKRRSMRTKLTAPEHKWYVDLINILDKHPEYLEDKGKSKDIDIYTAPMKTPHTAKVDSQGLTDVYSLSITFNPNKKQPFNVTLTTGKGKPIPKKAIGIQEGSYVRGEVFSQDLTADEWINIIAQAVKLRDAYVVNHIENQMNLALKMDAANRQQTVQNTQNLGQPGYNTYQQPYLTPTRQ